MALTARQRLVLIMAAAATGVMALAGIVAARLLSEEQSVTVTGRIVRIDLEARTAAIEFRHPKSGQLMTVEGDIPTACDIQIDGRPASLADLQVDETITVRGTIHWDHSISAEWARVTRAQPMTAPAGGAP